ncbi:MAG: Ni/Fe-hydrogenase, b-type cytochrome subunit, partial [Sulfurovum sp.]|nr:Ni/Fe-hydrogenase, b-type cytochrome subunit [Sulfurovum sp.]
MGKPEEYIVEHPDFVYSSSNRILHWIRALVITGLIITGFYIAHPFLSSEGSTDSLLFGKWAMWHFILGFILISSGLLRIYLFFFGKDSEGELRSLKDVFSLRSWIIQLKSYFFIGELRKKGFYGPLQFITYFMIMVLVVVASVTGLILYVHVYHQGVGGLLYESMRTIEAWIGGLAVVRYIHHITMWG